MPPKVENRGIFRVLFLYYSVGIIICLLTQLVVLAQHGPRIYASPLWGIIYPARLFIEDVFTRIGFAAHLPMKSSTVAGIGIALASALFGLFVPALVGLVRSGNHFGRYIGFALIVIFALFTLLWGVLPNVF